MSSSPPWLRVQRPLVSQNCPETRPGEKGKPPARRAGGFFAFRLLWGHRPVEPDQCFFLFLIEGQVGQDHRLEVRRLWQHTEPL